MVFYLFEVNRTHKRHFYRVHWNARCKFQTFFCIRFASVLFWIISWKLCFEMIENRNVLKLQKTTNDNNFISYKIFNLVSIKMNQKEKAFERCMHALKSLLFQYLVIFSSVLYFIKMGTARNFICGIVLILILYSFYSF